MKSERAIMMALLEHCSTMPFARVVRPPPRARAVMAFATASSLPRTTNSQSQVLLGLSEKDLQQLALDFGQVLNKYLLFFQFTSFFHNINIFQFLSKAFGGSNFIILYTREKSEKFKISFKVSIFIILCICCVLLFLLGLGVC